MDIKEMYEADVNLDDAVQRSVAADIAEPDVRGWLTMATHVRPDGTLAVWWASRDMSDQQLVALAESLLDEIEGSVR